MLRSPCDLLNCPQIVLWNYPPPGCHLSCSINSENIDQLIVCVPASVKYWLIINL